MINIEYKSPRIMGRIFETVRFSSVGGVGWEWEKYISKGAFGELKDSIGHRHFRQILCSILVTKTFFVSN